MAARVRWFPRSVRRDDRDGRRNRPHRLSGDHHRRRQRHRRPTWRCRRDNDEHLRQV